MILRKDRNIPENDKCIICKNYITITDIQNNNFELSITKRKTKVYAHKTCIERRIKNGIRNRRKITRKIPKHNN